MHRLSAPVTRPVPGKPVALPSMLTKVELPIHRLGRTCYHPTIGPPLEDSVGRHEIYLRCAGWQDLVSDRDRGRGEPGIGADGTRRREALSARKGRRGRGL